jgi:hypothetical protein
MADKNRKSEEESVCKKTIQNKVQLQTEVQLKLGRWQETYFEKGTKQRTYST